MDVAESHLASVKGLKGIEDAFVLQEADRFALFDIELEAEKKSFMGMGLTYNSGIRDVLRRPVVVLAITTFDFEWGCQSVLVLKKGDEIVGEQVSDSGRIQALRNRSDVHFLHRNFVIYKDRVRFPQDIVEKKCCFELPSLEMEDSILGLKQMGPGVYCFPSTPGDIFLKEKYYGGLDERGTGTVLFGFTESDQLFDRT
jgi:hypothetical protein